MFKGPQTEFEKNLYKNLKKDYGRLNDRWKRPPISTMIYPENREAAFEALTNMGFKYEINPCWVGAITVFFPASFPYPIS